MRELIYFRPVKGVSKLRFIIPTAEYGVIIEPTTGRTQCRIVYSVIP